MASSLLNYGLIGFRLLVVRPKARTVHQTKSSYFFNNMVPLHFGSFSPALHFIHFTFIQQLFLQT